jgi:hypothetical protein
MPAGVSTIKQAVEYIRNRIEASRVSLKQGKMDECAKALLEVALMTVTPMERRAGQVIPEIPGEPLQYQKR